jgi:hypothetical protein
MAGPFMLGYRYRYDVMGAAVRLKRSRPERARAWRPPGCDRRRDPSRRADMLVV